MKGKLAQKIAFAVKQHPIQILCALLLAISFYLISISRDSFHQKIDWLDPIIGIITLFIALLVWLIQLSREWEDSLSKRLTVQYDFNGKIIMICEEALLVGESDIRNWGQQIGAQMSFTPILKFDPYFKIEKAKLKYNTKWDEWYKFYAVTFYLNELPDLSKAPSSLKEEWENNFKNGWCLHWYPVYEHDHTLQKKEYWDKADPKRRI